MAKLIQVVDDFDKSTPAAETIPFAIFGEAYSLDLSEDNAAELREMIQEYIDVAIRLGKHRVAVQPPGKKGKSATNGKAPTAAPQDDRWYRFDARDSRPVTRAKKRYRQAAREHGREIGWEIGERGVVPDEVYRSYEQHLRAQGLPTGPASVGLS